MNRTRARFWFTLSLVGGLALAVEAPAADAASASALALESPLSLQLDAETLAQFRTRDGADTSGPQQVIVRLATPAVATLVDPPALRQRRWRNRILAEQDRFLERCASLAPGARLLGRTQLLLNAIFLEVDAEHVAALASDPAVTRVAPVGRYELTLSETVPYIGAAAVQADGFDGSGITVAVLDSGVDYTHANLGGPGTGAAYAAAYGASNADPLNTTRDGLFPTAKVVEGFDFVGEAWPSGPLAPDPDPIDFDGHGTHVADIAGGLGGVAPGVDILAVKVCSAISPSCSGVALIQGMEFAVDPNGDGNPDDHADVINMSLGSDYGQPFDDDLSQAVNAATALGVLTVSSAGNGGDKPYIIGSPAAAETALAVAQTQVPSANLQLIDVDGFLFPAAFQPWSAPLPGLLTGPFQYGDGGGGNLDGCDPFAPASLAGKIVLVDRGACFFTSKIFNIGNAGGLAGIIGLVAPGAPFSGGFADPGGPITIPGYMISLADANTVRFGSAGTIDPANQLPLVMQMVGSSSRGPRHPDSRIKPEIGAPGASVSAEVGTGTGETPFGGTSGASPMVAGAAALVLDAYAGSLAPKHVAALLVNTGETNIESDPFSGLAPITRIGGGEVRVDRALAAAAVAYDKNTGSPTASFGFEDVTGDELKLKRQIQVDNLTDEEVEYEISAAFRFAGDTGGPVELRVKPKKMKKLPPGDTKQLRVEIVIDGFGLPGNFMSSGGDGANPDALTANEFDGYIVFDDGVEPIHVPWHVLPRKAAELALGSHSFPAGGASLPAENEGAGTAQIDAYTLLAVSPNQAEGPPGGQAPMPDIRALGVTTIPVPAGFCSGAPSFLWIFAVNTWERQTHLVPVSHQFLLDLDQDGNADFVVLNRDLTLTGVGDGQQAAWAVDLVTGSATAFFFAEHAMNTGNTALIICAEQIGMSAADLGTTNVDLDVLAQDFYFGGPGDLVPGLTITPGGEQYVGAPSGDVAAGDVGSIDVLDFGPTPANTPELGVMLFTNGDRGSGAHGGATQDTEALFLGAPGADLSALSDDDDDL